MNYGGQTWSGGGGGGYDQGMGGINQSGPQEGDSQAMRWAKQNNPQLYAQYQQDKFAREQEQKKNPPWMGRANRLNDPAQKPGMGTRPGSQFIGGPPQQRPQQGQGNWQQPQQGQGNWQQPQQGQGNWWQPQQGQGNWWQPQQGQGNWSSPYSTANSGWGGPSGGQPQSTWGGGTPQQGGNNMANLMGSMYGNRRF